MPCSPCHHRITAAHLVTDWGGLRFWALEGRCPQCGSAVVKFAWAPSVVAAAAAWGAGVCWTTYEEALAAGRRATE